MIEKQPEITALCPWCGQGKTFADKPADIRVSCQCPFCEKFYKIDFNTMRAIKIRPKPNSQKYQ